jgi:phosphate transport system substrate-binding protein
LHSRLRRPGLVALVLAVGLLAAACGGNDDDGGSGGGGQALTGEIKVSGSSTVEPITSLAAEKFREENSGVNISVDGPGTGDGFKLFCDGQTDISDASRAIKPEETQACQAKNIEFIEMQVGYDGISVITSPKNTAVSCLSFGDLYALLGPEAKAKKWSDANALATKVGGKGNLPDLPLAITGPGEESGTYDSFVELAIAGIAGDQKVPDDKIATRKDYQASPNDNVIIEGVAGNDGSLGWVGYAFADQNKDKVKLLEVAGKDGGCVAPTPETIADHSYGLSRPLFIYVNKANAAANPALTAFVDYFVSAEGLQNVTEADYVAADDATIQKTTQTWQQKTAGTQQGS